MTLSDRLLKTVLILIGLVLFCITTHIFFGYGVVQAIENTGVMFVIHILMCFCIFRTSLFSLYAWIRYPQLRMKWGFWRLVMVHIFTACVAFWFFVEILSIQQWWSWLLLIPPIWLSLFQCVLYTDLKRMIRNSETPEHEKAVEKHGMKHTIQFFLKWMGMVVNVVLVVLVLWQFLWKGSLSHMILGGIAFLVIFLFFRVPVVNIRAWIRYPQLRTEWGFWLCSFVHLCLIFSLLVICIGWAEKTPDIVMREFPFYALGYIFLQVTVYIALSEMIKNVGKQEEKGKKWENILQNPEK